MTEFLLGQVLLKLQSIESEIKDLRSWVQRGAILALLLGAGLALNLSPDKAAEILTAIVLRKP